MERGACPGGGLLAELVSPSRATLEQRVPEGVTPWKGPRLGLFVWKCSPREGPRWRLCVWDGAHAGAGAECEEEGTAKPTWDELTPNPPCPSP